MTLTSVSSFQSTLGNTTICYTILCKQQCLSQDCCQQETVVFGMQRLEKTIGQQYACLVLLALLLKQLP